MATPVVVTGVNVALQQQLLQEQLRKAQAAAEQKAKIDALMNSVNTAKTALNNDYTRSQQKIQDSRTLANAQLGRSLNPFSGQSDYIKTNVQREYTQADEANQKDLQTRLSAYDQQLSDAQVRSQDEINARVQQLLDSDRQYNLQLQDQELKKQQQNYSQYADKRNFDYGAGRDTVKDDQWNQQLGLSIGTQTGRIVDPRAQALLSQILGLKQAAEQTTDSTKLDGYRQQADTLRNKLAALGIDPSVVGYDADYNTAVQNVMKTQLGTPTLGQRQFDANEAQRQWDNNYKSTDQSAQYLGTFNGQPTLQSRQVNASIANMGADNARAAAAAAQAQGNQALAQKYEIWDRTGVAPEGIPGVAAGTPLYSKSGAQGKDPMGYITDLNKMYVSKDDNGNPVVNDKYGLRNAIIGMGMDDASTIKLLNYYKLPIQVTSNSGGR
jgi:hypothetical protein